MPVKWIRTSFCVRAVLFVLVSLVSAASAFAGTGGVVISQIYGAGGLSGANYRQDFITLFNPTASTVNANGWAIQIRSATSSAAFTVYPLPNFTLAPGQYYMIAGSSATLSSYGVMLPVTPDYQLETPFTGSPYTNPPASSQNILSSTSQTIALTSNTTQIPAGAYGQTCPAVLASNLVDVVGFGPSYCYQGTGPAPTFTTVDILPGGSYTAARSTSITRVNQCVDQRDNSLDFVVTAQTFQNSASAKTPCPATQLTASGSADPGVVYQGSPMTFTATTSASSGSGGGGGASGSSGPGGTVSTGVGGGAALSSISINLAGIGGSATQQLYDDGTHGDAVSGDGVYSFATNVSSSAAIGTHVANVIVTDNANNSVIAPVNFTVTNNKQTAAIHTVQTAAPNNSNNNGVVYTVHGIVTGVRAHGFYLQARDSEADSDPTTSEAIYVNAGATTLPGTVVVGNEIQVTGVLTVVPPAGTSTSAAAPFYGTELASPTDYSVLSTGNAMPTAVTITPEMAAAGSALGQRYAYQSMLVKIPTAVAISGTSAAITESSETAVSDGHFFGVVNGTPRPFLEAGLSLGDPIPAGAPNTVQNFDGNGEVLGFDSTALGGAAIDVATGTTLTNVVAIDDYSTGAEQLLISASARPTVGTLGSFSPVIVPEANEFTVGTQNMRRFYSSVAATGAVTLTPTAYQQRLAKAALQIRTVLLSPDVLAVQEMGTLDTLTALANKVNADAVTANDAVKPNYVPYLLQGNDSAAVNVGLLVNSNRVTVNSVTQVSKAATYTDGSGSPAILFDDPPLVLDATVKATGTTAAYPVIVVAVDLADGAGSAASTTAGATLRLKRRAQAESIATLVQSYQAAGKKAMVVGDFGSPEFSDGVVDVLGLVKGTPTASANVVLGASSSYTAPSPALWDLASTAPAQNRYSVILNGSAMVADHVVVTGALAGGYMVYGHDSVDFPGTYLNSASRVESNSNHDGGVAYFPLPALTATSSASITPNDPQDFGTVPKNTASRGQVFTFTNTGNGTLTNIAVSVTGDFAQTTTCGTTLAVGSSCSINVTFTPTATGARTGTLKVTSSSTVNPTLTVSLTGTGSDAPVALLTLTPSSVDFGSWTVNTPSSGATLLLTNTGLTPVTGISIASSGDYTQTNSCGTTLPACSSCVINVVFRPSQSGTRNGTVTVNASGSPTLTSTLTGSGSAALTTTATVTPTAKDFGSVNVTQVSTFTTFTFTNTGTSTMTGVQVSTTGDFTQTNSCGYILNPQTSCIVNVTFKPTAAGTRTGTLNIASGSVLTAITTMATLTGTGVAPTATATLSPSTQDFGSVITGGSSSPIAFTFSNTGSLALSGISASVSTGFTMTNGCGTSLAAGGNCTINVTFKPTSTGAKSGTLTVNSSSSTSPTVTASLTGTSVAPTDTVTLTPATQSFGSITVGQYSNDINFTVTNTGNTDVNNLLISTTGPFQLSTDAANGGTNCGSILSAGTSCTITLTFNPVAAGNATGLLKVQSGSNSTPLVTSTLTGVGALAADSLLLTPTTQDFGSVTTGSSSAPVTFTLSNAGSVTVTGISASITGAGFAQTNTCGATLAAGASCTFSVTFSPSSTGAVTGTLTVNSNSASSPTVTSTLTGTGASATPVTFTLNTSGNSSTTVRAGSNATFALNLASSGGYTGTLSLSCSGAPTYSTCSASPASVTLTSGGSGTSTITITTSQTTTSSVRPERPASWIALGGVSFGLLCFFGWRKRKLLPAGLLAVLLVFVFAANGCGGGGSISSGGGGGGGGSTTHTVAPGTYTYTVNANDGTTTKSQSLTVIVQ